MYIHTFGFWFYKFSQTENNAINVFYKSYLSYEIKILDTHF